MNARHRIVGILLVTLALAACSKDERSPRPGSRPGAPRGAVTQPNVLVFTLDTTRADHLGCYGSTQAETTNLDLIAKSGARFEAAQCQVPLTLPSHASIFTGLLPPEHGLHDNGRAALPKDVPTLAELFARHGWRTGAFVSSNVLDASFGLNRGFEVYDDVMDAPDERGVHPPRRSGEKTAAAAMAWLAQDRSRPFFAWVHFYDPHSTYDPPSPWRERFKEPYDGAIAYMDAMVGRLLAALQQDGRLANTILVAVADHGESLGEHGEATHGMLIYESTMRVPLLIRAPGHAARVIGTPVQTIDIAPTIAELAGFRDAPHMSGRSLVAALDGRPLDPEPLYGESEYCAISFGWSPLYSLRSERWKYIRSSAPELYDLAQDKIEMDDRVARDAQAASALSDELDRRRASANVRIAPKAELNPALSRALQALGYVQSGSTAAVPAPSSKLRNPRDMMTVLDDFTRGAGFVQHGFPEKGVPLLEHCVQACPDGATFHQWLGQALFQSGRHDEARTELMRAIAIDPTASQAHYFLAQVAAAQKRYDDALVAFDAALALQPQDSYSLIGKAWTLVHLDKKDEAAAILRKLVETKPLDESYRASLARLLHDTGRFVEAVQALEDGLQRIPNSQQLTTFCAWERATSPDAKARDGKRALELAQKLVAASERKNPLHLDTLGAAYAELGRFDEAVAASDEALRVAGDDAEPELVAEWTARRALYVAKKPFRAP